MQVIKNAEFGGERPLYASRDLRLENITIHPGESALKECARIEAYGCEFRGKYPFWETDGFTVENCIFREGARAALARSGCRHYHHILPRTIPRRGSRRNPLPAGQSAVPVRV